MTEDFIQALRLFNISNQIVQIGVSETEEATALTEITMGDETIQIFPSSGLIQLYPGKLMVVEEDRINSGQIENHQSGGFLKVTRLMIDPETFTVL